MLRRFNNFFSLLTTNKNKIVLFFAILVSSVAFASPNGKAIKATSKFAENYDSLSPVELSFFKKSNRRLNYQHEKFKIIEVDYANELGKLSALSFLEWVSKNPEGVIGLPTGHKAEFFIRYLYYYLDNWTKDKVQEDLKNHGIDLPNAPDTSKLKLVQMAEFYPLSSKQKLSYRNFINKFYVQKLKLAPKNVLTINICSNGIVSTKGSHVVFQNGEINLTLLNREPKNKIEEWQQSALVEAREYCNSYNTKIREWGGIGFFITDIGPDGHILFNLPGAKLPSRTRLVKLNYPIAAGIAKDLGGLENVNGKAAITVGMDTILFNKDCKIIVYAIGEDKALAIKNMVENNPTILYPGSLLQDMPNSILYIAKGAAKKLQDRYKEDISKQSKDEWDISLLEEVITNISLKEEKDILSLTREDIRKYPAGQLLLATMPDTTNLSNILKYVRKQIIDKIEAGLEHQTDKSILHTAPHHDDIILSYSTKADKLIFFNKNYFAYLTSGYNGVSDSFLKNGIGKIYEEWLDRKKLYLFDVPYNILLASFGRASLANDTHKMQKIDKVLLVRNLISSFKIKNIVELKSKIRWLKDEYFQNKISGDKDLPEITLFKTRIRETEADKLSITYNAEFLNKKPLDNVFHLGLSFYSEGLFGNDPDFKKDIKPLVTLINRVNPDYITVSDMPEGVHPTNNFKSLLVVAKAIQHSSVDPNRIKVWGYRNIWNQYSPSEANVLVPLSKEELIQQKKVFLNCFASQKKPLYPSALYNGDLIHYSIKNQKQQFQKLKTLLGKEYFCNNLNNRLSKAVGFIFLKQMTPKELLQKVSKFDNEIKFNINNIQDKIEPF